MYWSCERRCYSNRTGGRAGDGIIAAVRSLVTRRNMYAFSSNNPFELGGGGSKYCRCYQRLLGVILYLVDMHMVNHVCW